MNHPQKLKTEILKKDRLYEIAICLICFTALLEIDVSRFLSLLLFIFLLFQKKKVSIVKTHFQIIEYKWISTSLFLYFFLHVVGLLYSPFVLQGIHDLETKLPLLLSPLLFLLLPRTLFSSDKQKRYILCFLAGIVLFALYTLACAFFAFRKDPEPSYHLFTNTWLLMGKHHTYVSMYYILGLLLIFYLFRKKITSNKENFFLVLLVLFFIGYLLLLASRGALLACFLSALILPVTHLKTRKAAIIGFSSFLLFLLISFYAFQNINFLRSRWEETTDAIKKYRLREEKQDPRIEIWINSVQLIKNHFWLGYGTGGKKNAMEEIKSTHYPDIRSPHNQFITSILDLGVFGLLSFMGIFIAGFVLSIKKRNLILFLFLFTFLFNCLFESMLERNYGTTYFSIFLFLILSFLPAQNQLKNAK